MRLNDLAFSLHCNLMTLLSIFQIIAFEKGSQRVSATCWSLCATAAALAGAYLGVMGLGAPTFTILGFLYLLSYIKLFTSLIKCADMSLSFPAGLSHLGSSAASRTAQSTLPSMRHSMFLGCV